MDLVVRRPRCLSLQARSTYLVKLGFVILALHVEGRGPGMDGVVVKPCTVQPSELGVSARYVLLMGGSSSSSEGEEMHFVLLVPRHLARETLLRCLRRRGH
jgi:hypothetical protein